MRVSTSSADRESSGSSPVAQPFSVTSGAASNLPVCGPAPSLPPHAAWQSLRRRIAVTLPPPGLGLQQHYLPAQRCTVSQAPLSASASPPFPPRVCARV